MVKETNLALIGFIIRYKIAEHTKYSKKLVKVWFSYNIFIESEELSTTHQPTNLYSKLINIGTIISTFKVCAYLFNFRFIISDVG